MPYDSTQRYDQGFYNLDVTAQHILELSPSITSNLRAEIHGVNDGILLGRISGIFELEIEESINKLGMFTCTIKPDMGIRSELQQGREMWFILQDEPDVVFKGQIRGVTETFGLEASYITVTGLSIAAELNDNNSMRGVRLIGASSSTARNAVEQMSTYWESIIDTGWEFNTDKTWSSITRRYNNFTSWAMALDMAAMQEQFIREEDSGTDYRRLWARSGDTNSGIRLTNLDYMSHELLENENIGIITSAELTEDGTQIYNRIIPEGKHNNDIMFTLEYSQRTSPYDIKSDKINWPNIVDVSSIKQQGRIQANAEITLQWDIKTAGRDRMIIVMGGAVDPTPTSWVNFIHCGGAPGHPIVIGVEEDPSQPNLLYEFTVWRIFDPPIGEPVKLSLGFLNAHPTSHDDYHFQAVAISLEDAWLTRGANFNAHAIPANGQVLHNPICDRMDIVLSFIKYWSAKTVIPLNFGDMAVINQYSGPDPLHTTTAAAVWTATAPNTITTGWDILGTHNPGDWLEWASLAVQPNETHYIEDEVSIAKYPGPNGQPRTKVLDAGMFGGVVSFDTYIAAIDSLYDYAVDYLRKHKDPQRFLTVQVDYLPGNARDWYVGDYFETTFKHPYMDISLDEQFICTTRKQIYGEDGVRKWELTLANVAAHAQSMEQAQIDASNRTDTLLHNNA